MRGGRLLLLWPGVAAAAVSLGRGSYVALVTPMDAANAVDYGALRGLLEWHVASGTDGVVALGTTGEASTRKTASVKGVDAPWGELLALSLVSHE